MNSLLQLPATIFEKGLFTMNSAFKTMQSAVQAVAGEGRFEPLQGPPFAGPTDMDTAVADFANRLARIARFTYRDLSAPGAAFHEAVLAARTSFGQVDLGHPHIAAFPVQLALSFGTLFVQQALRLYAAARVVGAGEYLRLLADFFESFTDAPVFLALEYRELLDRFEGRLAKHPDDAATRCELGRTQIKCGFNDEAANNLLQAAASSSVKGVALHEAAVALYRAGRFEQAAQAGSEALTANPNNERARHWLWLTAQKMGGYPAFIPAEQRMEVKAGYETATIEFEDIATKIGVDKTSAGRGLAVFDYNNDGLLDIVITAAHAGCNLYRNNGDGTFTDVSVGSGLDTCVNGFIIAAGDYNNDGYTDLFVNRLGFYPGEGQLFRNNGDGTFTDVTEESGLKVWGPAFATCWVDYDCDGHLDLFIANNLGGMFDRKVANRLFHNNGDGTFTEVTEASGISTPWPTIGATWADYNNDGFPDLFLSNALGRSVLYRNNGDGTFTDVSAEAGITEYCFGSTSVWCDYNNDGWMDILQFNWSNHEAVVHTLRHGEGPRGSKTQRLYHNNGDGTFTARDRDVGLSGCWGTMSGNVGDFNNDGNLDVVLGNGSPRMDRLEPPILLQNDGERFHNITFAAGLPFTGKGHGANMADLFGDGRLSVLLSAGGAYPGDIMTTRIFYPVRLPGNYLNVRLVGTKSNRSAIGARIGLEAGGKKQYREVSGGSSFGCLPFEQHFGLAGINKVDAMEIRWPSGLVQRFTDLPANDTLSFTEGERAWQRPYRR